jgi:hypothetical protein
VSGALKPRRFPPQWSVEDIGGSFVVKASNDRPLMFIYYCDGVGRRSLAKLLSRNAARRIAANITKLPELLLKPSSKPAALFCGLRGSARSTSGQG